MEGAGIRVLFGHSVNFPAILSPFGIFYGHLVYFPRFGIFTKKNLATLPRNFTESAFGLCGRA
jgi:hypothetical protein